MLLFVLYLPFNLLILVYKAIHGVVTLLANRWLFGLFVILGLGAIQIAPTRAEQIHLAGFIGPALIGLFVLCAAMEKARDDMAPPPAIRWPSRRLRRLRVEQPVLQVVAQPADRPSAKKAMARLSPALRELIAKPPTEIAI